MRLDDDDEVTEFQVDEQSAEARIERVRGTGKLTIRLVDPLRVGAVKRLVMKTRRPFANAGARRISFSGFPLVERARTNGLHRHHPECEPVRQAVDVARAAPGRHRQIAGRPARSPVDEPGLRVSRSAVLARSGGRVVAPLVQGRFEDPLPDRRRSCPERDDDRARLGSRPALRAGAGRRGGASIDFGRSARSRRQLASFRRNRGSRSQGAE